MEGCRADHFRDLDKPKLKPLPEKPYEIAEFKLARVNINYHIEVTTHNYSVPHTFVHKKVEVRYTPTTVEVFYKGNRIASHARSQAKWKYSTLPEHMPEKHRQHVSWTPERMSGWAAQAGPKTKEVADAVMASKPHPQQAYKSVLGLIRMGQSFGPDRLEAACSRAIAIGSPNYSSIKSILKRSLDRAGQIDLQSLNSLPSHSNIRGPEYFTT
jgi:transposase